MSKLKSEIDKFIIENSQTKYADFQTNLIPGINNIAGVRTPDMKKFAKRMARPNDGQLINELMTLPIHQSYEMDLIKGLMISYLPVSFAVKKEYLDQFSYEINNWAVCDTVACSLKIKADERDDLLSFCKYLTIYDRKYSFRNRFGIIILMRYFLTKEELPIIFQILDTFTYGDYYLDMGVSWLMATAMINFFDETISYLNNSSNITAFVYKKSLTKAIESYRISEDKKTIIRNYRQNYLKIDQK